MPAIPIWAAVGCAGLFLLVMAPWWLRQLAVFGQLSPSTSSGRLVMGMRATTTITPTKIRGAKQASRVTGPQPVSMRTVRPSWVAERP